MNKRLIAYVDELFIGIKKDRQAMDMKEELLANSNEKYNDLISGGKGEEEAYQMVIAGIGDIKELMNGLYETGEFMDHDIKKNRGLRSIFLSLATSLYLLSLAVVFIFDQLRLYNAGIVIMLFMWAAASGLIVYGNSIGRYKYEKKDNTFAESYKEQLSVHDRAKRMRSTLSALVWSATAVLYFSFSFVTAYWHISWIFYLAGIFFQLLVLYRYGRKSHREAYFYGMLLSVTVIVYFVISFAFRAWAWSWILFIVSVAVSQIIKLMKLWREEV